VSDADSPLRSLGILVPEGAYPTATTWTVSEVTNLTPTLPAGVRQVGPAIRIANGQEYSEEPFTIELPARVPSQETVAAFYYESTTGTFEALPMVARTDTSVVIITRHVSTDQLLIPPTAGSGLIAQAFRGGPSAVGPPGVATLLLLASESLQGTFHSGFRPGVDDWDFSNWGSHLTPGGYCAGSALTAMYHYVMRKGSRGQLFGLYDSLPGIEGDNVRGMRLASVVQHTLVHPGFDVVSQQILRQLARVGQTVGGPAWVRFQTGALALAIKVTGAPQLLAIFNAQMKSGHAIIAQGIDKDATGLGIVYVTDPNEHGRARNLHFTANALADFQFAPRAGIVPESYPHIFPAAVTALLNLHPMASRWAEVESKTIGNNLFPVLTLEYLDPVDTVWRVATDEIRTASPTLTMRTLCPSCPGKRPTASNPDRMLTVGYDDQGAGLGNDNPEAVEGLELTISEGKQGRGFEQLSLPAVGSEWAASNFVWLMIDGVPFDLVMDQADPEPGETVNLTVENGGMGRSTSRYRWTAADEPPAITAFSVREFSYTHPGDEPYWIKVELLDVDDSRLAADSIEVNGEAPFWRITSIVDQDGLFAEDEDGEKEVTMSGSLGELMTRLWTVPTSGLIAIEPGSQGGTELKLRVLLNTTWTGAGCCPPDPVGPGNELVQLLGVDPTVSFTVGPFFAGWNTNRWSQSTTALSTGTLTGRYLLNVGPRKIRDAGTQVGPGGAFVTQGVRNGATMTGTITLVIWWVDDDTQEIEGPGEEYRLTFTATRLR